MKKFLSIISALLITVLLFTACEYTPTATSVDTKQTLEHIVTHVEIMIH